MSKNLVIVESPAKAKTIEGYLGKDFIVKSSYGHVRDLPSNDTAIDVENGFHPTYEITADKKAMCTSVPALHHANHTTVRCMLNVDDGLTRTTSRRDGYCRF